VAAMTAAVTARLGPLAKPVGSIDRGARDQPAWCAGCLLALAGSYVTASGQQFHYGCFLCSFCAQQIDGSYCQNSGTFLHPNCLLSKQASELGPCAKCKLPFSAESFRCRKMLTTGGAARAYHAACFACDVCAKPIDGSYQYDEKGSFTHPNCLLSKQASELGPCAKCKLPFSAESFRSRKIVGQTPLHAACFVCVVCDVAPIPASFCTAPFWGDYYCAEHTRDGTASCASCGRKERRSGATFQRVDDPGFVRELCADCSACAVRDEADAAPIYADVISFFRRMGAWADDKPAPPLRLASHAEMEASRTHALADHPGQKLLGLCFTTYSSAVKVALRSQGGANVHDGSIRLGAKVKEIMLLRAQPFMQAGCTLAHEMAHAHLNDGYPVLDRKLEEGLCEVRESECAPHASLCHRRFRRSTRSHARSGRCSGSSQSWGRATTLICSTLRGR